MVGFGAVCASLKGRSGGGVALLVMERVVYRPPRGDMGGFNEKMAEVVVKLRGVNGYILGDFNADLIKVGTHAPTSEFLGGA